MAEEAKQAADGNEPQGQARIRYGAFNNNGNHAGKTVKEIRDSLGAAWNMQDGAKAFSGSTEVNDDHVIGENEAIEFHRKSGEKG